MLSFLNRCTYVCAYAHSFSSQYLAASFSSLRSAMALWTTYPKLGG